MGISRKNKEQTSQEIILAMTFIAALLIFSTGYSQNTGLRNDGAKIVIQPSTKLNIYGGINLEQNSTITNSGDIRLTGDWANNSEGDGFSGNDGKVELIGSDQVISGTSTTRFNDLDFIGQGVKLLQADVHVAGTLIIRDKEVNTGSYTLLIENPDPNAIERTSGMVSSDAGGGLLRRMDRQEAYLFPLGSSFGTTRYRPVEVTPASAGEQTVKVGFINHNPLTEGYDPGTTEESIGAINTLFYHLIDRTTGFAPVKISFFFDQYADDNFNGIARWKNNTGWGFAGPVSLLGSQSPALSRLTIENVLELQSTPFAFFLKGLTINADIIQETAVNTGSILLRVSGGKLPYIYEWNGVTTKSSQDLAPDSIFPDSLYNKNMKLRPQPSFLSRLPSDIYEVKVIDAAANEAQQKFAVGMEPALLSQSGVSFQVNTITKTTSDSWGNGVATMANVFHAGEDGEFRFELDRIDAKQAIGLRFNNNPPASQYQQMDYAFYIDQQSVNIWENGQLYHQIAQYQAGDILSIERTGQTLLYRLNDQVIRSTSISSSKTYLLDISLFDSGSKVKSIKPVKLPFWPVVKSTVTPVSCGSGFDGAIDIDIVALTVFHSFTYQWFYDGNLISTSEDIAGLGPGEYTVIINYSASAPVATTPITKTFTITGEVGWTDLVNATASLNSMTKIPTGAPVFTGALAGGGASVNTLSANLDGWVEFRPVDNVANYIVAYGLSASNADASVNTIEHGMVIFGAPYFTYIILESGNMKSGGYYLPGSKVRIERQVDDIHYLINGSVVYSSTPVPSISSSDLLVDASIFTPGATMADVNTSFPCPDNIATFEDQYYLLKKKLDGGIHVIRGDQLRFKYHEDYATATGDYVDYRIYNTGAPGFLFAGSLSPLSPTSIGPDLNVEYQDNWYEIDLCGIGGSTPDPFLLEVVNQKGEKQYLKFIYFPRPGCQ